MSLSSTRPRTRTDPQSGFTPARILLVDLDRPLPAVPAEDLRTGHRYRRALSVVRLHMQPLGVVELSLADGDLSARDHARLIWCALEQQITEHLREDDMPMATALGWEGLQWTDAPRCLQARARLLADPPLVSVVVATRDRPVQLASCLQSLLALDYPRFEIVVVDNASSSNATAQLVDSMADRPSPPLRCVREERPGLSSARNRGLQESRGEVVAFTDDDVLVDESWLSHLVAGFNRADHVACVTGNILPVEMETPAQSWLEQFGGFSKGFTRRIYDLGGHRVPEPLYPYTAGRFGSGANSAFRVGALREMGGFDPCLGTGTRALGGEDLAIFFSTITRGYRLVYEPAAIVYHRHGRGYAALKRQIFSYGVGLTAYVTKCMLENPRRCIDVLRRVPYGLWFTLGPRSPKNRQRAAGYPRELTRLELLGMAYGPLAYLRSRWHRRTQGNGLSWRRRA